VRLGTSLDDPASKPEQEQYEYPKPRRRPTLQESPATQKTQAQNEGNEAR
jgi:hypothetical protein